MPWQVAREKAGTRAKSLPPQGHPLMTDSLYSKKLSTGLSFPHPRKKMPVQKKKKVRGRVKAVLVIGLLSPKGHWFQSQECLLPRCGERAETQVK